MRSVDAGAGHPEAIRRRRSSAPSTERSCTPPYTPVYRYGISFNKLFEYMAAERPVVFACDSAYDPVRAMGAGISVSPDDPELLAGAFLELAAASPEARTAMGAAGRDFVAREHNMERLGGILAAVVEGRPWTDLATAPSSASRS